MTMLNEPCQGTWVSGRNICHCPRCRRIADTRSGYISAAEQVNRLLRQNADVLTISNAEVVRERMGEQWREAAV